MTIPSSPEEMDSIQVFQDLPAVHFNEDLVPGVGHFDTSVPKMDRYSDYLDYDHRPRPQTTYAATNFQTSVFTHPQPTPFAGGEFVIPNPFRHQLQHHPHAAHDSHFQHDENGPWAWSSRTQPAIVPYDSIAPCSSDGSRSPCESAHSPRPSFGGFSSSPTESINGHGPLTPFSNVHGGYSSQQHIRRSSILSGKSVTMREIYEPPSEIDAPHEKDEDDLQPQYHPSLRHEYEEDENVQDEPETEAEAEEDAATTDEDRYSDYSPSKKTLSTRLSINRNHKHHRRTSAYAKNSAVIKGSITKKQPRRRGSGESAIALSQSRARTNHGIGHNSGSNTAATSAERRRFICSFSHYGCTSTFANKNEWKRHIFSQHLKLGFYRCDIGDCNPYNNSPHQQNQLQHQQPSQSHARRHSTSTSASTRQSTDEEEGLTFNDFNRKDLFTQHLRRMHSPCTPNSSRSSHNESQTPTAPTPNRPLSADKSTFDALLPSIHNRCYLQRRSPPPSSTCGFCGKRFTNNATATTTGTVANATSSQAATSWNDRTHATTSWDERMEHVGRHLESGGEVEREDLDLRDWGYREGILVRTASGGYTLAG